MYDVAVVVTFVQTGSHTDQSVYKKAANSSKVETKDGYMLDGSFLVLLHAARSGMYRVKYLPKTHSGDATAIQMMLNTGI